jgi:hypothetical protein
MILPERELCPKSVYIFLTIFPLGNPKEPSNDR